MPFQEFVNSGFGLWTPDCTHVNRVRKQRREFESVLSQQSVNSEERESNELRGHDEVGEDRDLEDMALSLVENRNDLLKHLAKTVEAMKKLEAENEKTRSENDRIRAENDQLKTENEKWKSHVESMITDTRVSLEEIRRQAGETVRLQKENEKLRNENTYRHLIMQQMKKRSEMEAKTAKTAKKNTSVFDMFGPCG
ncbi:unnamed protein product [Cylindrotheca closterium]|uniref:Uncharacterized protein n=1 Tax=Cylindrotheca closterium TaxID=2856 RepID=A0AAD2CHD0_9STRA|nr:unnamed protein product [Cylindrotheca closterium]